MFLRVIAVERESCCKKIGVPAVSQSARRKMTDSFSFRKLFVLERLPSNDCSPSLCVPRNVETHNISPSLAACCWSANDGGETEKCTHTKTFASKVAVSRTLNPAFILRYSYCTTYDLFPGTYAAIIGTVCAAARALLQ